MGDDAGAGTSPLGRPRPPRPLAGMVFYKMSGSGNDFVVVDVRDGDVEALREVGTIRGLCARGTGVGADGLVLLEPDASADFRMAYYNADGSRASMCGNAALCSTRLAHQLGARSEVLFQTDSGAVRGRLRDGEPEIDLDAVTDVRPAMELTLAPGETRVGYAVAGVPHLVVLRDTVEDFELVGRGRALRMADALQPAGANVNFVAPLSDGRGWTVRTYERGVEGETLACGTGAIATSRLLIEWCLADGTVRLRTRSGRVLSVRFERDGPSWRPSLRGEGRLVYRGELGEPDQGASALGG